MRRCLSTRRNNNAASIEMAPLIDMIFLLLIFYIVSARFVQESAVKIERPESSNVIVSNEPYVAVTITRSGSIYIADKIVSIDEIGFFSGRIEDSNSKRVVIQADREVTADLLLKVMDVCKAAGAKNVDVAAIGGDLQ